MAISLARCSRRAPATSKPGFTPTPGSVGRQHKAERTRHSLHDCECAGILPSTPCPTGRPSRVFFAWECSSGGVVNQSNQIEIMRHRRELSFEYDTFRHFCKTLYVETRAGCRYAKRLRSFRAGGPRSQPRRCGAVHQALPGVWSRCGDLCRHGGGAGAVYRHLDWLKSLGRTPMLVRTVGSRLGDDLIHDRNSIGGRFTAISASDSATCATT